MRIHGSRGPRPGRTSARRSWRLPTSSRRSWITGPAGPAPLVSIARLARAIVSPENDGSAAPVVGLAGVAVDGLAPAAWGCAGAAWACADGIAATDRAQTRLSPRHAF